MQEAKIKFDHVTKVFHTRSQDIIAVKDYSMEIRDGEFVAILGPSGCGKSTLIRMLDGIIPTTEGDIFIDGKKVNYANKKMPSEILRKMGFIFQQPNMLPWFTVRQNVALPLDVFGLKGKQWQQRVDDLLEMVHDPEILLMDEPYGALDELTREQMNMELLDIWSKTKKTIIFITHNIEEAVLLSDKVYVMGTQPGRLVEVVDLDLPRPRKLSMITETKFINYRQYLENAIGEIDLSKIK